MDHDKDTPCSPGARALELAVHRLDGWAWDAFFGLRGVVDDESSADLWEQMGAAREMYRNLRGLAFARLEELERIRDAYGFILDCEGHQSAADRLEYEARATFRPGQTHRRGERT